MAKRLNKKVALIGSAVLLLLVLSVVGAIWYLGRDPEKFVKEADAALLAKNHDKAWRAYLKAYQLAKSDTVKIEILFKLEGLYIETDEWPKVRGCWEEIINVDPKNVTARLARLKYLYIVADNYANTGRSVSGVWSDVQSQASELIRVAQDASLMGQDKAKWERSFGEEERPGPAKGQTMGSYLYLVRGRAALELARMGAVTAPDELLTQATDDLQKVQELDPANVDAYRYLAEVSIERGEILASRGNLQEREKAAKQAEELLERAIEAAADNPQAYINLLSMKLNSARKSKAPESKKQVEALEPAYRSLASKFPSSAEAFAALSRFYSVYSAYSGVKTNLQNLDQAVEAMEKATDLEKENVSHAIAAANLYYRRCSVHGQKSEVFKAIAVAKTALGFPDAQNTAGPRSYANRMNRFLLCSFLANCYIEQVLEPYDEQARSQSAVWLANAEQAVHEIEQISGSEKEPQVLKWQGMLELAKGNVNVAVRQLYEAYQQIKASKPPEQRDALLSYTLAKIFQDSSEVGAVTEFLVSALEAGIELTEPAAILDYLEILGKRDLWSYVISPVNPYNVSAFEEAFGPGLRTKALRIRALMGTDQITEAEEELAKLDSEDPNTIKLSLELVEAKSRQLRSAIAQRQIKEGSESIFEQGLFEEGQGSESDASTKLMKAELDKYQQQKAELVQKLLLKDPALVEEATVTRLCRDLISQGQNAKAEGLVNRFLACFPDSTDALIYKKLLAEPEPTNVSEQKHKEITKQIISNIADPVQRALKLGFFYRTNGESDKAAEQFKRVLEAQAPEGGADRTVFKLTNRVAPRHLAASYLFDIATDSNDWQLAGQIAETVRRENLDDCEGHLFAARLATAKGQFKDALTRTNECLRQRPVFSRAYLLRSNINAALGNDLACLDDVQKAAVLNPMDGIVAKALANALYRRNLRLGGEVSSDQVIETRRALERAMALNPGDLPLLSAYAEYISPTEPLRALAIRQTLQKNAPTLQNAILLAKLATGMAVKETNEERKTALFQIAASSLEQARKTSPDDRGLLETYAEYYRARGENDKAEKLLRGFEDQTLLWRHYFNLGRFEEAEAVLQRMYQKQPKDPDVVRGLFLVAERTINQENVNRYSEELVSLEDNAQNRLDQIKAYLKVGLVKESEYKLQSFKEKYPNEQGVLLLEGWLAMRQGQLKKALELTNRNLETNQENAGAWRLRGEINLLMADCDQAIIDLQRSKSLSVTPDTRMALARAYLRTGREDDAITELKNTIDLPGAPMEARPMLEQTYLRLGRKEALRKFYDETLQKFPQSALWYNRAAGFAMALREFASAEQLYQKAYLLKRQAYLGQELTAGMQDVQYAIAMDGYLQSLVLAAGSTSKAGAGWHPEKLDKVFEESAKYVNTPFAPIAYYRMAEAKLSLGDRETAVEYCRTAVDKTGANERLASEILLRMFLLLEDEEVSKYCLERLKTTPDSLAANFTMFNLAKIRGEYDKAVGYIDKCIELTGAETPRGVDYTVKKAQVLAIAYERTSDNHYLKKAITDYESLLAKMPNNTLVLNNLAYMLAENNERLAEALEYAKRALEQKPNDPGFLDTYAYVLCKNGKDSEADEFMTAALLQYGQNQLTAPPEVYEHLGMIKERLGQKSQALDAYKDALEVGSDKLPKAVKDRITSAIERLSP
jgi:tetratricopeptide (TPR) repeat protein